MTVPTAAVTSHHVPGTLQWYDNCRCGDKAYDAEGRCDGTNCRCNARCTSTRDAYCGGAWANSVYITRFAGQTQF